MLPNHRATLQPDPSEPNASRLERVIGFLLEPIVLLTVVHLSILALGLPLLERLPGWFFRLRPKTLAPWYLVLGLAVIPALGWLVARRLNARPVLAIWALVFSGFLLQHGFAWSEGRGFDGIRKSIVTTGHAEFAVIAVRQPSMWDVVVHYEDHLKREGLGRYAHSKPPGTLLFYMATERIARVFAVNGSEEARLEAVRNVAAVVWPFFAYLPLFPLFFTLHRFVDDAVAYVACLLYLVTPSIALMTLHTDECLFPLVFTLSVWLAVETQTRRSGAWAFVTGACLYLSAFFTFALLLAIPMVGAFTIATELQLASSPQSQARTKALLKTAVGVTAGFCVVAVAFLLVFNYDMVTRLRAATLYHAGWRNWQGGAFETVYFAWLNYLEFAVWIGVPLTLLTLAAERDAILRALRGGSEGLVLPALVLASSFLYLGFLGQTKAESGRLWLLLVPMCCGLAAAELQRRYSVRWRSITAVVVALQWLTVCLTKVAQDFW